VRLLSKVAERLAKFTTVGAEILIKVILSDQFAPTEAERVRILSKIAKLPGVQARIYVGSVFQHRKNYIFRTKDEIRVIVGSVNVTASGLYRNLEIATLSIHNKEDPEALKVISSFESMWGKSKPIEEYMEGKEMIKREPLFSEGQNVRIVSTGKIGTINKVMEVGEGYNYRVTIDGKMRTIQERFLEPFIDVEETLIDDFLGGNFGGQAEYKMFQTWFRLSRPIENNLYSYLGSKTIFNPHQFKPLLRFLSPGSDERLFIADEVGVGKTIEAGIIITELLARNRLNNHTPILVVCPNSLGPKWGMEMKERFGLNFHFHNGESLKYTLQATLQDGIFPAKYIFSIASIELFVREPYINLIKELDARRERPIFGMVVVDESHHMRNSETISNELGKILSNLADAMLLLSATPLNLRNEDLYNQMHILNPIVFPDKTTFETLQSPVIELNKIRRLLSKNTIQSGIEILNQFEDFAKTPFGKLITSHPGIKKFLQRLNEKKILSVEEIIRYERLLVSLSPLYYSFTRTRKREALKHQVQRDAWEVPITLSKKEMKFYIDIIKAIEKFYLSKGGDPQALGFVTNTHRRMASSCIPAMREYLKWSLRENQIVIMDERKLSDEIEDDSGLQVIEINPKLKEEFTRLFNESKEIEEIDSKYNQFKQILTKILSNAETPQVMVFSFFIRTLEYLKYRLEADGFSVDVIHGGIPLQKKQDQKGRYEIMEEFKRGKFQVLLSSEVGGEGLDFQFCSAIINYDLPYNPMRIEQRIGRIDRFGQKADKIIVANLFIQGTIDEEIYIRLYRRIRIVEDGIGSLEPILGKKLSDIQTAIITGNLTEAEKDEMSRRLEEAVQAAKQEMEEFERHRSELLSDDYLAKPINAISKSNFVSPEDAIQLTDICLSNWDKCSFKLLEDSRGEIALSENKISLIEQFLRRPNNERGYNELKPLLKAKDKIKVVFDGTIANQHPDHVFLPPTGFWTRFLLNYLENEKHILKIFKFGIKDTKIGLSSGDYLIFLFEVRIEGFRTEIEFVGIPVNVKSNIIPKINLESLLRYLAEVKHFEIEVNLEDLDLDFCKSKAEEYLDLFLETRRKELAEENRFKIASRITAIKKSCETKIKNFQEQIEKHKQKRLSQKLGPEKGYMRIMTSRIENEKRRSETKIIELKKFQELTLDYNLEGIIYIRVVEE